MQRSSDPRGDIAWIIENLFRHMVAFRFEGDMCEELLTEFRDVAQRGEESGTFDFGLHLSDTKKSWHAIIGIDIKTVAATQASVRRNDRADEHYWQFRVNLRESQQDRGVFLLGWPLWRSPTHWTVLPAALRRHEHLPQALHFRIPKDTTSIEPVIHPKLIPFTLSRAEAKTYLNGVRQAASDLLQSEFNLGLHDPEDDAESRVITQTFLKRQEPGSAVCSADTLRNQADHTTNLLISLLRSGLRSERAAQCNTSIPRYAPYTSDLHVKVQPDIELILEIKIAHCTIIEENETSVKIHHERCHKNHGVDIFTFFSGRWTHLLTEISPPRDRISVPGGKIPRMMLFLPRRDLPQPWWNSTHQFDLQTWVAKKNIIDMRHNPAAQLLALLRADTSERGLPPLEDVTSLQAQPRDTTFDVVAASDFLQNSVEAEDDSEEAIAMLSSSKTSDHGLHRKHQSRASLQLLQECFCQGSGTIIDYLTHPHLRTYAFTNWQWTSADLEYVATNPLRSPRQLFEIPRNYQFLQLSFGLAKFDFEDNCICVHPFVLEKLREDARVSSATTNRRLLVLQGQNDIRTRAGGAPVYAIPASIVDYMTPKPRPIKNRSRWRSLKLQSSLDLHTLRFPSLAALLIHLVSALDQADKSTSSSIEVCDISMQLVNRDELYEEIFPGYQQYLDPKMAIVMR